jgi:hypothetical protein
MKIEIPIYESRQQKVSRYAFALNQTMHTHKRYGTLASTRWVMLCHRRRHSVAPAHAHQNIHNL